MQNYKILMWHYLLVYIKYREIKPGLCTRIKQETLKPIFALKNDVTWINTNL